jgi:hypothetical protein
MLGCGLYALAKTTGIAYGCTIDAEEDRSRSFKRHAASPVKRESVVVEYEQVAPLPVGSLCKTEPVDPPPPVGHRRKRDAVEDSPALPPPPYQYVRRENDDRWTVGWI